MSKKSTIGKVANITTGKLDSNDFELGGIYPFFTCAPDPLTINSFSFDDEVILVAGNNAKGNFHINKYSGKFDAYQRTYVITEKDGYSLDYIYYSLQLDLKRLKEKSQGSQTKFLTKPIIENLEIRDISLDEQIQTVSLLKLLDEKLSINRDQIRILEDLCRKYFEYWFIQYDFPSESDEPYASSNGPMIYSQELKRNVPENWVIEPLKNHIRIISGFPFKSNKYVEDGVFGVITIKNVQDLSLDLSNVDRIEEIPSNLPQECKLDVGDILISLTGNVGRICIVDSANLLLNQRVGKISSSSNFYYFSYLYFQRPEVRLRLEKLATRSSQSNLSPIDAVEDLFLVPNEKVLNGFNNQVKPLFDKVLALKSQNYFLKAQKDFLMPLLVTGQITSN